jgi:hypothetical protein
VSPHVYPQDKVRAGMLLGRPWADEDDIAFLPPNAPEGEAWRWAEQWIPHTGWFLLAVAAAR